MAIERTPRTFSELRRAANMRKRMGLRAVSPLQLEMSLNKTEAQRSARALRRASVEAEQASSDSPTESRRAFHQYLVPIALAESGDVNNA